MTARDRIVEGLRAWAAGSYPEQVAVDFLAATNEPLSRPWVVLADGYTPERYWFDWQAFRDQGGYLSGGEYATWAIAESLCEGDLYRYLWAIDTPRFEALHAALAGRTTSWRADA